MVLKQNYHYLCSPFLENRAKSPRLAGDFWFLVIYVFQISPCGSIKFIGP